LNFRSDVHPAPMPSKEYSEARDLTLLKENDQPLAESLYLLGTQTKTETAPEGEQED
jgi:hypothetical protein